MRNGAGGGLMSEGSIVIASVMGINRGEFKGMSRPSSSRTADPAAMALRTQSEPGP